MTRTTQNLRSSLARKLKGLACSSLVTMLVAGSGLAGSESALASGQAKPMAIRGEKAVSLLQPTATTFFGCESRAFAGLRLFCYGPAAMRAAYGVDKLIAKGYDGTGQTIVIVDAYGSPTMAADLAAFSTKFGLPPADITEIRLGAPFDPTDANQLGWAEETSLDVQWSHAIAPGAKIILIAAASNNDPDLLAAQDYAINHHLGGTISESYGESETALYADPTGAGLTILANDEASYARARAKGIAVFVSSGDSGSFEQDYLGNPIIGALYPGSSPNVTSVGGTNLYFGTLGAATPNGQYLTESVWNDGYGAGGGGVSGYFATPSFQTKNLPASTLSVLGGYRGYPDVTYNAGVVGGVLVYLGFLGPGTETFYIFGGTSSGAPQWAAIASDLGSAKGEPIGNINNRLYKKQGFAAHDIVAGQNGFNGFQGYIAAPAFDLSSGWGSPTFDLLKQLISD